MKEEKRKLLLRIIVILSLIGLATSIYLVKNHYAPASGGSFCDINATVSCSLVNTSVYSELFNVPVAIFGALWFVFLLVMTLRLLKKASLVLPIIMLGWSILGLLFIIYMIMAEFILQAICPFCTVVHVIVVVILILVWLLYKASKKPSRKDLIKAFKPWLIWIVIINLIPLIVLNWPVAEKGNYDELAKCITEKGVNMYGSFRCGICAKQRATFGNSFQYINEIECHPQGKNPETERCIEKGLEGTPTWILEPNGREEKRQQGFMSLDELREFSGCDV